MWKYDEGIYRFQTNDRETQLKLHRRKKSRLCAYGWNTDLWVYDLPANALRDALKLLEVLTGGVAKKDALEGVYVA